MNRTLRISFSLRNTYRVNSILYAMKQIPLIKKALPDRLYGVQGFKVFANILSVLWEITAVFLGKMLYFLLMVTGTAALYKTVPLGEAAVHILVCLSIIGSVANTFMFNPSKDKYYAIILMRMDAREYTLVNYSYAILKVIVGFFPAVLLFGFTKGIPLWLCLLVPFFIAGLKLTAAACSLRNYEKTGNAASENKLEKWMWTGIAVLLALAYGLPALGVVLPVPAAAGFMLLAVLCGAASLRKILTFTDYRDMYQRILAGAASQMDTAREIAQQANQKVISTDTAITSSKTGFAYLNELFIRRHRKILWESAKRFAGVLLCLILGALLLFFLAPDIRGKINRMILTYLPYFVIIMYFINRGTGFTRALFMNCDHSLLTYSFYKQPRFVLKLFKLRLVEIIKVNLLPAAVLGTGLAVLLYASGGTENPLNYVVLVVSILCLSIFFSVHYLTVYYLLQPYNAGTEIKSGTYQMVLSATYLVCYFMMRIKMSTLVFGIACIVFCVLYSILACVLVYRYAPKTFRLRA